MATFFCQCLNIRLLVSGNSKAVTGVVVAYPTLVDIAVQGRHDTQYGTLICLLCGWRLFEFPLSTYRQDARHIRFEFQHPARESVVIPRMSYAHSEYIFDGYWLRRDEMLDMLKSINFSNTFGLLLSFRFAHRSPGGPNTLFNGQVSQLAQIVSSLCDVVINHLLRLRADILTLKNPEYDNPIDKITTKTQQMVLEFQELARVISTKYFEESLIAGIDQKQPLDDFLLSYLARIDVCYRELCTDVSASIVTAPVAGLLVTEGVLSNHSIGSQQQARLTSTKSVVSFPSLPAETAWKILEHLRPVRVSDSVDGARRYCDEYVAFGQLMLVSRSWADMVLPLFYHTLFIYPNLTSLTKLCAVLANRGPLVRAMIIHNKGPEQTGPKATMEECLQYIEKSLECCTRLLRLECYELGAGIRKKQLKTLILKPSWGGPYDISEAISDSESTLQHLEVFGWQPRHGEIYPAMSQRLPQCRSIELRECGIQLDYATTLVSMAVDMDGKSTLRRLSLIDLPVLQPQSILELLNINKAFSTLTEVNFRLLRLDTDNEFPIQVLKLCPLLVNFSYTSQASVEVFDFLPPTLRALELAIFFPSEGDPLVPTIMPSLSSLEEFTPYIQSERSANLKHLAVILRLPRLFAQSRDHWKRLNTQFFERNDELRSICKQRHIQFDLEHLLSFT